VTRQRPSELYEQVKAAKLENASLDIRSYLVQHGDSTLGQQESSSSSSSLNNEVQEPISNEPGEEEEAEENDSIAISELLGLLDSSNDNVSMDVDPSSHDVELEEDVGNSEEGEGSVLNVSDVSLQNALSVVGNRESGNTIGNNGAATSPEDNLVPAITNTTNTTPNTNTSPAVTLALENVTPTITTNLNMLQNVELSSSSSAVSINMLQNLELGSSSSAVSIPGGSLTPPKRQRG
jgi:hypothetical protein